MLIKKSLQSKKHSAYITNEESETLYNSNVTCVWFNLSPL
jgi:hypothetical protein